MKSLIRQTYALIPVLQFFSQQLNCLKLKCHSILTVTGRKKLTRLRGNSKSWWWLCPCIIWLLCFHYVTRNLVPVIKWALLYCILWYLTHHPVSPSNLSFHYEYSTFFRVAYCGDVGINLSLQCIRGQLPILTALGSLAQVTHPAGHLDGVEQGHKHYTDVVIKVSTFPHT